MRTANGPGSLDSKYLTEMGRECVRRLGFRMRLQLGETVGKWVGVAGWFGWCVGKEKVRNVVA